MKHGVVSDAMNKIPEEYKLEALELLNQAEVSEITNMKSKKSVSKIIAVACAATITLAVGATVAAKTGVFGTSVRKAEPSETVKCKELDIDENTGLEKVVEVDKEVKTVIEFDGESECQGIEFKLGYLPPVTTIPGGEFGDPYDWNEDFLQFETDVGSVTVSVYYDSQFGTDGVLFLGVDANNIEQTSIGEYDVYKFDIEYSLEPSEFDSEDVVYDYAYNYVVLHHPSGHIIVVGGSDTMDTLSQVAENIQVQYTDKVYQNTDMSSHSFEAYYGVG